MAKAMTKAQIVNALATKTGLTIFWPDDGLDEGPILMQKECDIGPDETLGDVYFKKLFPMGVDAMIESLDLVKQGKAPKIGQLVRWILMRDSALNRR